LIFRQVYRNSEKVLENSKIFGIFDKNNEIFRKKCFFSAKFLRCKSWIITEKMTSMLRWKDVVKSRILHNTQNIKIRKRVKFWPWGVNFSLLWRSSHYVLNSQAVRWLNFVLQLNAKRSKSAFSKLPSIFILGQVAAGS